jgi:hypothetical protein
MADLWVPKDFRALEMGDDYSDSKHERHPHGVIIVNGQEVGCTLQCPHCGGHFRSVKGSGHRRTFCLKCQAVTCGSLACDPCRPFAADTGRLQGREF